MNRITSILFGWLDRLPNSIRAGINTAWFVFLAVFGLAVLDVLADLLSWASTEDAPFPDLSVLGKALVAAVVSAASGIVNTIIRFAQERTGAGKPPIYTAQQRSNAGYGGAGSTLWITQTEGATWTDGASTWTDPDGGGWRQVPDDRGQTIPVIPVLLLVVVIVLAVIVL